MDETPDQQPPEVSTEPQRQALDEMSHQLVERLNDMVREQHERARRFAATQHSLSPLPGIPGAELTPEIQASQHKTPQAPQPQTAKPRQAAPPPPKKKQSPLPPLPFTRQEEAQEEQREPLWQHPRQEHNSASFPTPIEKKKGEENGCGTGTIITLIIIVLIIIRACS